MSPRTEQELLDCTVDLAIHCRWSVHHDRPARRGREELRGGPKWHTAIQGHAGFPDLVLARAGVVLFRELKGYDKNGRVGRLSSEQRDWGRQLARPGEPVVLAGPVWTPAGAERDRFALLFDVWTPDDWDTVIVPTLTAKPQRRTA